ncbi:hypothetical protein V6N12_005364 [Hibiscus sabdariffa]|uniref:Secreted protein n=1 Tax=Hibiscus sabdariffa TaxID=183260 RepID=A0ABR2CP94_9ROSI
MVFVPALVFLQVNSTLFVSFATSGRLCISIGRWGSRRRPIIRRAFQLVFSVMLYVDMEINGVPLKL